MENNEGKMIFYPSQEVLDQANVQEYDQMYRYSLDQPEAFWAEQADQLSWFKKWDKVLGQKQSPLLQMV